MRLTGWTTRFLCATAAGTLALSGGLALAQTTTTTSQKQVVTTSTTKHKLGHARTTKLQRVLTGLNLSQDQWKHAQTLTSQYNAASKAWSSQNKTQIREIRGQIKAARLINDKASLRNLHAQYKLLNASKPRSKDMLTQVRALLGPDQQKQFDSLMASHLPHHHKKA